MTSSNKTTEINHIIYDIVNSLSDDIFQNKDNFISDILNVNMTI